MIQISDKDFGRFQRFIFEAAGISIAAGKKEFVAARVGRRIAELGLGSYDEYLNLVAGVHAPEERQRAIDSLTTNETYFFREPKHFELVRELARTRQTLRVWSAACSSGEEVYSIAMVLADVLGETTWEVLGSDIGTHVLARAQRAHYPLERTANVPGDYLKRFCLKGVGAQEGTLLVGRELRRHVSFKQINLNAPLPMLGTFDIVFLRNVLIYFDGDTKRSLIRRLLPLLGDTGYLCIGHSETLHELGDIVRPVAPATYCKRRTMTTTSAHRVVAR